MRLKLLLENIKHHFLLSFFILFVSILTVSCLTLAFETESFLYQITKEDYLESNHNYDIVIKSNTGLSLTGTKGDNNEFEELYKRKSSFYNATLYIENNINKATVSNVFEGSSEDLIEAFDINIELKKNEAVITKELSNNLNLNINDSIKIYIGDAPYEYKIVSIVDSKGMYTGESIFITGYNVSSHYALRKMYNLILLDVENDSNLNDIYQHVKNKYHVYSVTNLNDQDYIETLSTTTVDEILIVVSIILIIILLLLLNIYTKQLKKQADFFYMLDKSNYYKVYQLIAWVFIIAISFVSSFFIVQWYFDFFLDIYNSNEVFNTKLISHFISCIPLILIIIFRIIPKIKSHKIHKKLFIIISSSIIAISMILYFVFSQQNVKYIFLLLILLFGLFLIIEIIFNLGKYIPSFLKKLYIYDLSKEVKITKISMIVKIFIVVVTSIVVSTIVLYDTQINSLSSIVDFDRAIVTKNNFSNATSYDKIQIDNKSTILNENLSILIGLNSEQYDKYLNYFDLSDNEKELFDSNEKYIILPKYFNSIHKLKIGDDVELLINEKIEKFKVLKFVNHFYTYIAIVNHSENMYYGYILNDDINEEIIEEFSDYKYSIIDFKTTISSKQSSYMDILLMLKYSLVVIILIMILLSIYISYQEQLYQYENLKKLKLLGCNNKKMLGLTLFKLGFDMCICIVIGFAFTSILLANFDNIVSNFNTIFYISYDIKIVLFSIIISLVCLIISFIYTNIKYKNI